MTDFQDRGDAARRAAGIDGTAGDAQDIPHAFVLDKPTGSCLLCGLAESYRKHDATAARVPTPGCDCGHAGMDAHWHPTDCAWRTAPTPTPGLMQCPTCGPHATEPHFRLPGVDRCANCKTHVPAPAGEHCGAAVDCGHPADEHSVYGCADGCACEWMPKRAAPIRRVPRLAGPAAVCSGQEGFCDVHGFHRHAPAPDGLRDLYAAAIEADLEQFFRDHPEEPRNSPWVCGMRDAAAAVRAETATADQLRADVQRERDRLREQLAEARGQIERVRKAVAERRTELAEYEAEQEPSAWSDAVSVTCSRIEDALRIFPESVGIPCAALPPKDPS